MKLTQVHNGFLRAGAMIVALLLAVALIFSGYGGLMNPAFKCWGAIAAMLFPVVLVMSLVMALVGLLWFRRTAVVTLLSLAACWGPILTFCPLNFLRPSEESIAESGKPVLKVMTYNMLNLDDFSKGFCRIGNGNPTLEYVLEEKPDILVCQEAELLDSSGVKNISEEQHSRLSELYPYRYSDVRGMGIASRYPFKVVKVEHAERWSYDVVRYDVALSESDTLKVFNLHLQSLSLTADDKALYRELTNGVPEDVSQIRASLIQKLTSAFRHRAVQAQVVRDAVASVHGPVLVCGDFNDIPGCYAQRTIMESGLKDAYREAGLGPAITYHADRFWFRIDHILYRGDLKPLRAWNGSIPASDHFPLMAIFEIPTK